MGERRQFEKIPSRKVMPALALGTVQFGLQYGVANRSGRVRLEEVRAILDCACRSGIDTLDTAIAYGDSEHRLGELGVESWRVISKLPPLAKDCRDVDTWVDQSVRGSIARLRKARLDGLLLHRSLDLLGPHGDELYRALVKARELGLVEKIGVSIYSPEELSAVVERFRLDLVQAPFNIIDRRLQTSGWLRRLNDSGTEVHVRSVFLQGLLLMKAEDRPVRFIEWETLWQRWSQWLVEVKMTPLQACLAFALSQREVSRVIVGVDREEQLREILKSATPTPIHPPDELISLDPKLINPLSWITS
jgi:aryl-alcohol dehydrogenase-like predicted oxidoreductase